MLHTILIPNGTSSTLLETSQQRYVTVDIHLISNIHQLCFVSDLNGLYAAAGVVFVVVVGGGGGGGGDGGLAVAMQTMKITSKDVHIMPRAHASTSCAVHYTLTNFSMCGREEFL
jgi:hypothetical protein